MSEAAGPLDGIRVLDLTRVLAGPYCTMFLGDLGAEVVKIEQPGRGDDTRSWGPPFQGGESAYFLCVNRNKRSVTLDLRTPDGIELLRRLALEADVLMENFRPGTLAGWGFSEAEIRRDNPRLIYASLSAFGASGPMKERPGYDLAIQAWGGLMSITGPADSEPSKVGVAIIDVVAGLMLGSSIAAALYAREQTGEGQRIETSLMEAEIASLINAGSNYLVTGKVPGRWGNAHPNIVPYQSFPTADGHLVVAVANEAIWARFCEGVGKPELAADPRFDTNAHRVENRDALIALLDDLFRRRPGREWIELLNDAGVPCSPVQDIRQVFDSPQVRATEMLREVDHPTAGKVRMAGLPVKFSGTPASIRLAPPRLGEHNEQVLKDWLELDDTAIAALRDEGTLG
ncbi:MAG: CoA transferase [Deltaproteobacteria bacterium]|nr:CoA transferase [Deltaproteobacteria bacterium]